MFTRPVWAEISRHNLLENFRQLRTLAGTKADLLLVVKANAYGHGLMDCAPALAAAGAEWIGVTCVEEGVRVRAVCPQVNVLVMSGVWRGEAETLLEHRLTPVVWEPFHLDLLERAAARLNLKPQTSPVHLEIDTGMARQGIDVSEAGNGDYQKMLARLGSPSPLRLEALMTHFSAPEELHGLATSEQMARFKIAVNIAAGEGLNPRWLSAGNSATLLSGADTRGLEAMALQSGARLLLRPGLALYGYPPRFFAAHGDATSAHAASRFHPVLSFKTRVTSLRTIGIGDGVGYNSTFHASRITRLALLPCGYADGVSRLLSNRGSVLIRGERAPILGRVSMDQTVVDVTGMPGVEIGDETVLIGSQGNARPPLSVTAYDIADQTGTIPYEVLCGINLRVPRVLVD